MDAHHFHQIYHCDIFFRGIFFKLYHLLSSSNRMDKNTFFVGMKIAFWVIAIKTSLLDSRFREWVCPNFEELLIEHNLKKFILQNAWMEINDLSYGRFHSNYTNYLKIEELFGWYRNINTTNSQISTIMMQINDKCVYL